MRIPIQRLTVRDIFRWTSGWIPRKLSDIFERVRIWGILPVSLGSVGNFTLFLWSLGMVLLVPYIRLPLAAALCLLAGFFVHPHSVLRILRPRQLVFLAMMIIPPLFFWGEIDRTILGIGLSSEGLQVALQISLRFVVIVSAMDGFTSSVDISALAGLLERIGLQGLGFSLGVALNLVPSLQTTGYITWQSLWMRGGLRFNRWRGVQLFCTTVATNVLRRAENITLTAEIRAFSPEKSQPLCLKTNPADYLTIFLASGVLTAIILL